MVTIKTGVNANINFNSVPSGGLLADFTQITVTFYYFSPGGGNTISSYVKFAYFALDPAAGTLPSGITFIQLTIDGSSILCPLPGVLTDNLEIPVGECVDILAEINFGYVEDSASSLKSNSEDPCKDLVVAKMMKSITEGWA